MNAIEGMGSALLKDIITPKIRKPLYAIYAVIGLVLGGTQVGFSAAELGQPVWLTVALAVFAFVGTALGFTASANTNQETDGFGDGPGV